MQFPFFSRATSTMMTVADVAQCLGKSNLTGISDQYLLEHGFYRVRSAPVVPTITVFQITQELPPEFIAPPTGEPYYQQRLLVQDKFATSVYPDPADPTKTITVTKAEQEFLYLNSIKLAKMRAIQDLLKQYTDTAIVWPGDAANDVPECPVNNITLTQLGLAKMTFDAGATAPKNIVFANGSLYPLTAAQVNSCLVSISQQSAAMVAKAGASYQQLMALSDPEAITQFSTGAVFAEEAAHVASLSSVNFLADLLQEDFETKKALGLFDEQPAAPKNDKIVYGEI